MDSRCTFCSVVDTVSRQQRRKQKKRLKATKLAGWQLSSELCELRQCWSICGYHCVQCVYAT